MSAIEVAIKILSRDEGFREFPYYCSEGYPTIGYGFRIAGTGKHDPLPVGMRIGKAEAVDKLRGLVEVNAKTMQRNPDLASAFKHAGDVRQAVMLSIAHQIGIYGLLKFKKFLAAMRANDYHRAAGQLLDSLAAKQTPQRWSRNSLMIESGALDGYYL